MTKIIDPWGSELVEDYEKIVKDFGLETFDPKLFPNPNRLMRRGVIFAGRDLKRIADAIKSKKKFYVLTGLMPSGERLHMGNKMVVEMMKYFQDQGAETFILVADLEAAAARCSCSPKNHCRSSQSPIPPHILGFSLLRI